MIASRFGIPVTNPARTVADLRSRLEPAALRRMVRQAEVLGLETGLQPGALTRSELEHRFLAFCHRHHLPRPEVNVRIGPITVDFLWQTRRLVVETDGYRFHRGSAAFEDDHDRDLILREHGLGLLRLTYRQVTEEQRRVAELLRRELER